MTATFPRHLWLTSLAVCAMVACAPIEAPLRGQESTMFDQESMDDLEFLVGRWVGEGPDGMPFYEEYRRVDANTLVSERYDGEAFANIVDGSTVSLEDGAIFSRWGDFSWRADELRAGFASFAPVNAPSAFTWRSIDADTVEVTQNWTDENGLAQSYALQLNRIK